MEYAGYAFDRGTRKGDGGGVAGDIPWSRFSCGTMGRPAEGAKPGVTFDDTALRKPVCAIGRHPNERALG
jgi:hypothetical protein